MAMYARISTIEGDAGKIDDAVAAINEKVLPTLKGIEGFTAANFTVDRSIGKMVAITFWASEDPLEKAVEAVNPIRTAVVDAMVARSSASNPTS